MQSCIIFSHTDVANEKKLEEALALVKEHNPGATVILTPWDQLSGADILSAMEHKDTLEMELQRLKEEHEKAMAEEEGHHHHHHHDGEEDEEGHHHHHDDEEEEEEDEDEEEDEHHHHHEDEDEDLAAADIITIIMTTRMRMGKNITIITTATKTRTMVAADTITTIIIMRMKFSEAGACRPGKV